MSSPLTATVDRLLNQLDATQALHTAPVDRTLAGLPALSAACGLLAMVVAGDEVQLEFTRRVLADLAAESPAAEPARAVALLSLVLGRHLLAADEEAQRALAAVFQEHDQRTSAATSPGAKAAARLSGAARLLALTAVWLDRRHQYGAALGRLETAACDADELETALTLLDTAMTLLARAAVGADWTERPAGDPLRRAVATAGRLAERLSEGRGG